MRLTTAFIIPALALVSVPATAASQIIDSNGILTGATGVNVNGALYDVSFQDGTCASIYGVCDVAHFDFSTVLARVAAVALLQQVFTGIYDSDPSLTYGCYTTVYACDALIPFDLGDFDQIGISVVSGEAQNGLFDPTDAERIGFTPPDLDTRTELAVVFARFTPSAVSVPEPATWALMLLGFGVIGLKLRRKVSGVRRAT